MDWHKIFDSVEDAEYNLPVGKPKLLQVNGKKICLARTQSGFYAVADSCPHLGESLSKGTVNYLNEIVCPWHSYRYHLISGEECKDRSRAAQTFPLENRPDGLFIGLPETV